MEARVQIRRVRPWLVTPWLVTSNKIRTDFHFAHREGVVKAFHNISHNTIATSKRGDPAPPPPSLKLKLTFQRAPLSLSSRTLIDPYTAEPDTKVTALGFCVNSSPVPSSSELTGNHIPDLLRVSLNLLERLYQ
jgi:hypothetical protein